MIESITDDKEECKMNAKQQNGINDCKRYRDDINTKFTVNIELKTKPRLIHSTTAAPKSKGNKKVYLPT